LCIGPWRRRIGIGVVIRAKNRSKSLWGSIVKVFGLLSNTILTCIGETSLNAPLAWSLISWKDVSLKPSSRPSSTTISTMTLFTEMGYEKYANSHW
jgi:hypothetical protein